MPLLTVRANAYSSMDRQPTSMMIMLTFGLERLNGRSEAVRAGRSRCFANWASGVLGAPHGVTAPADRLILKHGVARTRVEVGT